MEYQLMATMASGFEAVTARELKDLGYETETENGRVLFKGDQADIVRTNLWLRSADRIKIILKEFKALSFEDLFQNVKAVPFEDYLPMDARFPVTGRSVRSKLHSEPDIQAVTKKAIVERLSEFYHRRTRFPETGHLFALDMNITKDKARLTLDTTGDSLFKRGYRVEAGGAPMKENMAAALILLTTWHANQPFVDPMTGSGTLPIEAALIAKNIAPGLKRNFSFEAFDWFDTELVVQARQKAESEIQKVALNITGYDINENMIDIAKLNANNAGVLHDITFKQLAVKDFKTTDKDGVIIVNPPYGQRLSTQKEVRRIYQEMGEAFRPLTDWSKYILTSDLKFESAYGQKATKRRKLYNGALRADYFQYWAQRH
ncbi:class I SAM-dependent RNA methyltransferase [Agrilactobacillus yilanensis]|uniref:Class I SAM-dependent RNA methyltransferase n=1 Tax=Agrilactobacillus yilanensis TaxID=2485997 RepID=A0ABW4J782_9LACO|nr:class I SAM-dependent RNA methyltransferase [Agrilactobacillus yilanensis]